MREDGVADAAEDEPVVAGRAAVAAGAEGGGAVGSGKKPAGGCGNSDGGSLSVLGSQLEPCEPSEAETALSPGCGVADELGDGGDVPLAVFLP